MISAYLALLLGVDAVPKEFGDYLRRPEPAFAWKTVEDTFGLPTLEVTSQTWQGSDWKHQIVYAEPGTAVAKGTAVLFITGGKPGRDDMLLLRAVTAQAGLPTAVLFDIPNQPLWGMSEDDLIAHTFEKALETGDYTWPLLFPMAKSAIKAMDAIQAHTKDSANPIKRFVVTGASKRGWTTWLVGAAGDKRVAGIAPLVIDNLNVAAQMRHQIVSWGKYSEQIEEYTRRGLQAKLDTPEGQRLARMVDPYSYRDRIKVPTMIVNGGNDRYWTVDALGLYWDGLKQPKWAVVVPNAGHDLGDQQWALRSVTAFARSCAGALTMPRFEARIEVGKIVASRISPGLAALRVWAVESATLDFREAKWSVVGELRIDPSSRPVAPEVVYPRSSKNQAVMVEAEYQVDGLKFSLTTPVKVFRPSRR